MNVGVGLLRTSGLAVDGLDVGSANGLALLALLEEVVGTAVVDVSIGTGGHGRNGGNSNRTLHCKPISPESDKSVVFSVVFLEW